MIAQLAPMIPDMFAIDTSASDIKSQAKADICTTRLQCQSRDDRRTRKPWSRPLPRANIMKAFGALGASCKVAMIAIGKNPADLMFEDYAW